MCVCSDASSATTFPSLAKPLIIFRKGHYARTFLLDIALVLGVLVSFADLLLVGLCFAILELFGCCLWYLRSFMKTTSSDCISQ